MNKIFTVLILNFLRSRKRPGVFFTIGAACVVGLAALIISISSDVSGAHGQQANVLARDGASTSDSAQVPASQLPVKPAAPQKNGTKQPTTNQQPAPSSASGGQTVADVSARTVTLDTPVLSCSGQQPVYTVATGKVGFDGSSSRSTSVRWYWETRVDSGDMTASPVVNNGQTSTQAAAAGAASVTLTGATASDPLLSAAAASTYSYSVRLHLTSPGDIVSDWVSLPAVASTTCQTS